MRNRLLSASRSPVNASQPPSVDVPMKHKGLHSPHQSPRGTNGHVTARLLFGVVWTLGWVALSNVPRAARSIPADSTQLPEDISLAARSLRGPGRAIIVPSVAGRLSEFHHSKRELPTVISQCTEPGTMAITFDDGPSHLTESILELLEAAGARATFFVVGFGTSCMYDDGTTSLLQRMVRAGHQIGSHTWTHSNLQEVTSYAEAQHQLDAFDIAAASTLGGAPRFFRPPWGGIHSPIFNITHEIGVRRKYAITLWDTDSEDWNNNATLVEENYARAFDGLSSPNVTVRSLLALNHDTQQMSLDVSVPYILRRAKEEGLRLVTVGECIGFPDPSDWYHFANPHDPAYDAATKTWTFPARPSVNVASAGDNFPRRAKDTVGDLAGRCVM